MCWRLTNKQFEAQKGAANRCAFEQIVRGGEEPGILCYRGDEPIGWCAIAPRSKYPRLGRSRVLAAVDEQQVWSITCFFVAKPYRREGVSVALLRAAVEHARNSGAQIVEGYPVEPKKGDMPDPFVWTGLASAYRATGFTEVVRRSETRPIMRLCLQSPNALSST
ncbi:GNAT family N-acetyltransferase [bacterium]|nr:GNAT family N-acetyltransferase [bacterium]